MANALKELGEQFDKAIIPTLRANSIGKMLMPVNPDLSGRGLGVLNVKTLKYVARSGAAINYDIQQDIADTIDITSQSLGIPIQQDDVIIKRRDYEAYLSQGVGIENDLAIDMAANIAAKQTSLIINGWSLDGSTYQVKGMYQVAGNTTAGADTDTVGNGLASIAAGIKELKSDNIYSAGYNVILAESNYAEVEASTYTSGISEMDLILKLINRGVPGGAQPGQVFPSSDLAAGTGMVAPVATPENLRFFDIVETQAPSHQLWFKDGNTESGDIMVRQVGALVPRFKHLVAGVDNCICTITGLGAS